MAGSVTWTLTQTSEQTLNTSERKILRRIYGLTHEGGCWRPRWNNERYSLYSEPNIVVDIKIRRLEWAGHIIRMEEERIPKKVLNGNFHTRKQWEDQELDGRMWFRGMHYNCWGQEDGGEELRIEMNGSVLWGRPGPGRGCSATDGMDGWFVIGRKGSVQRCGKLG